MEYLEAGRLLYRQCRRYLSDVLPLFRETLLSTVSLIRLYLRLLLHLLRPVLSLLLSLHSLLSPLLSSLLARLWAFFVRQPARVLAIEAALAIALLAAIALERRFRVLARCAELVGSVSYSVRKRYRSFVGGVRQQSRLAAAALPHLLFAAVAFVFHRTAGTAVEPIASGATGLLLAVARPAFQTVKLLYVVDADDVPLIEQNEEEEEEVVDSPDSAGANYETPSTRRALRRRKSTPLSEPVRTRARARLERELENEAAGANGVAMKHSAPLRFGEGGEEDDEKGEESQLVVAEPRTPPRRRRTAYTPDDEAALREAGEAAALRFWVVFGLCWAARSIAWYFIPAVLGGVVERLDVALLYVLLWAQLGLTRGADVVYGVLARVARRRWRLGKRGAANRAQTLNVFVRLAVAANLISAERATDVTCAVAESGFAMIGVVFLITPRVATFLGTLLVGLLVPCYLSTAALEAATSKSMARHNCLSYWAVLVGVEYLFVACADMFGWLPLWYHVKMVLILWLQLPYYRGSVAVLDGVMRYVGSALSSVRRQIVVTPRKRKRA